MDATGAPSEDEARSSAELDLEVPLEAWRPLPVERGPSWDPDRWPGRPMRYIDGKDRGEVVAVVKAPDGLPVAIRLATVGAVAVEVTGGVVHRVQYISEPVVSLVAQPFPTDAIEAFAAELQHMGVRLLPASLPQGAGRFEFERTRKAAEWRTTHEMTSLEAVLLSQRPAGPTVVDGRLEQRRGSFDPLTDPVVGVIKSHRTPYLHDAGWAAFYALAPGERTPLFRLVQDGFPVVTWFLRLDQATRAAPGYGVVRVEVPGPWFDALADAGGFVRDLSLFLRHVRCRRASYGRSDVSLHPIVRAEELLGACFEPTSRLQSRFCRAFSI